MILEFTIENLSNRIHASTYNCIGKFGSAKWWQWTEKHTSNLVVDSRDIVNGNCAFYCQMARTFCGFNALLFALKKSTSFSVLGQ